MNNCVSNIIRKYIWFGEICDKKICKYGIISMFGSFKSANCILHYAAKYGNMKLINMALRKGVNIKARGLDGAAKNGNVQLFKYRFGLLQPSDFEYSTTLDYALGSACAYGHIEIIKLLIEYDKNKTMDYNFGVYKACKANRMEIYKFMETVINKINYGYGLAGACLGGHIGMIKFLIDSAGGQISWYWGLFKACQGGHIEAVKFMIDKFNQHITDTHWEDCLSPALSGGNAEVIEFVISNIKNKNFVNKLLAINR